MKSLRSVFNKFKNSLLSSGGAFAHDLTMIPIAWLLAYWIRFNLGDIPVDYLYPGLTALMFVVPIQILAYWRFGLYRGMWRFASMADMMRIGKATLLGSALLVVTLFIFTRLQGIPRSVLILYPIILVLLLGGPRFIYRWFKDHRLKPIHGKRVLIIGAGSAGEMLARDLLKEKIGRASCRERV